MFYSVQTKAHCTVAGWFDHSEIHIVFSFAANHWVVAPTLIKGNERPYRFYFYKKFARIVALAKRSDIITIDSKTKLKFESPYGM